MILQVQDVSEKIIKVDMAASIYVHALVAYIFFECSTSFRQIKYEAKWLNVGHAPYWQGLNSCSMQL